MPKVTFTKFRNVLARILRTHQHSKGSTKAVSVSVVGTNSEGEETLSKSQWKHEAKVSAQTSQIKDLHSKLDSAIAENSQMWNSSSESSDEEEEWETISYEMVCQILNHHLNSTKLPYSVKYKVKTNITNVEVANVSLGLNQANLTDIHFNKMKHFDSISLSQMAEYQKRVLGERSTNFQWESIISQEQEENIRYLST